MEINFPIKYYAHLPEVDASYLGWFEVIKDKFQLTKFKEDPAEADLFILPINWDLLVEHETAELKSKGVKLIYLSKTRKVVDKFFALARAHEKKVVVFYNGLFDYNLQLENAIIVRPTLIAGSKSHFVLPYFLDIPELESYESTPFLSRRRKKYEGLKSKKQAFVKELQTKLRSKYTDWESRGYVFVDDGIVKNSKGLYEALKAGKVPVVVDDGTDLPYDFLIDYKVQCLMIPSKGLEEGIAIAIKHYDDHTDAQLKTLGERNTELWKNFLTVESYFFNFHYHLPRIED